MAAAIDSLRREIAGCSLCADELPLGPRPVCQIGRGARVLIIGQAPGRKVHASGIPFDDASGRRLRDWMGIDDNTFYDAERIAIVPMGFCFPGSGNGGDRPPRPECAPAWHARVLAAMPAIELTLLLGRWAQQAYLADGSATVTDNVVNWRRHWPDRIALPHPSPRNNRWLVRNPWFEAEVLPAVKQRVTELLTAA